jgi:hypothetical protein
VSDNDARRAVVQNHQEGLMVVRAAEALEVFRVYRIALGEAKAA